MLEGGEEEIGVFGFEEDAEAGSFVEIEIASDEGHIGDDGIAEEFGEESAFGVEHPFHAFAGRQAEAALEDELAEFASIAVAEIAEPNVVGELTEAEVEAFGWDAGGDGLDGGLFWGIGWDDIVPLGAVGEGDAALIEGIGAG